MIIPWIEIPADDVRIQLPINMHEKDVKLMFRNAEVIDKTIKQLQNVKELYAEKESHK